MDHNTAEAKREWATPTLVVYGDVEELTLNRGPVKQKQPGSTDDFGVTGVSDFP